MGFFDKLQSIFSIKSNDSTSIKQSDVLADDTSEPKIITLSSLLENAVPSKKGLYPHEILMLDYANKFPVDFATANYEFQSIKLHQRLFTNADCANIVMAELS